MLVMNVSTFAQYRQLDSRLSLGMGTEYLPIATQPQVANESSSRLSFTQRDKRMTTAWYGRGRAVEMMSPNVDVA
jgi:hypothetical protein